VKSPSKTLSKSSEVKIKFVPVVSLKISPSTIICPCLVTVLEGEGQMIVDGEIFKLTTGTNFILTSEDLQRHYPNLQKSK
jgi:mannose-6-phosphate isomerase class I